MRRLLLAVRPGHRPGLDRGKAKPAFSVCRHPAVSLKTGLQPFFLRVFRMSIFSVRIGLPDFQNRIRYRNTVAVKNSALNTDTLAGNTFACQVVTVEPLEANLEERADRLRRSRLQTHLFLHRRGFTPAQDKVEAVTQRVPRHRSFPIERRYQ